MRVLGIDPGLTRCGWGVIDGPPAAPSHVAHGVVQTAPQTAVEQRLHAVHEGLADVIAEHRPDVVAVERVLFSKNSRTAMVTGQASGVALLAAAQAGLAAIELTPTDVKLSVTGDGGADKDGVTRLVTAQLSLAAAPRPADAADALAIALAALARARVAAGVRATGRPAASWEDLVADRGLRVRGGTGRADARAAQTGWRP